MKSSIIGEIYVAYVDTYENTFENMSLYFEIVEQKALCC